jgi:microcystin-dependent protein
MAQDQGFPIWNQPFVDPKGFITQAWRQFLVSLWNRTGGGAGTGTFEPGDIKPFGGLAAPSGWLECDGQAISRTTYSALYAAIGTTWGSGDGSTTFNLPDLRGRSLIGANGTTVNVGDFGGAATITLNVGQLPAHAHAVTDPGHTHVFTGVAHTHVFTGAPHTHVFAGTAHTHVFTGTPHTHAITDPGHLHTITDPQHNHASIEGASPPVEAQAGAGGGFAWAFPDVTGSSPTGITIDPGLTLITVDNSTAAGTNANTAAGGTNADTTAAGTNANTVAAGANAVAATGITTQNTGSGDPVPTQSPYAGVMYLIKT